MFVNHVAEVLNLLQMTVVGYCWSRTLSEHFKELLPPDRRAYCCNSTHLNRTDLYIRRFCLCTISPTERRSTVCWTGLPRFDRCATRDASNQACGFLTMARSSEHEGFCAAAASGQQIGSCSGRRISAGKHECCGQFSLLAHNADSRSESRRLSWHDLRSIMASHATLK